MKQFKKIIALALALVLSLSLAACASKTETAASTETASTETASETTESKGTITVAASPTPHAEILAQAKPILSGRHRRGRHHRCPERHHQRSACASPSPG